LKKAVSKSMSLFLILLFTFSLCIPVSACVPILRFSKYLSSYDGVVTREGGGTIKTSFTVIGIRFIDEIGASQIVVQKQVGGAWISVKTFNNTRNPFQICPTRESPTSRETF